MATQIGGAMQLPTATVCAASVKRVHCKASYGQMRGRNLAVRNATIHALSARKWVGTMPSFAAKQKRHAQHGTNSTRRLRTTAEDKNQDSEENVEKSEEEDDDGIVADMKKGLEVLKDLVVDKDADEEEKEKSRQTAIKLLNDLEEMRITTPEDLKKWTGKKFFKTAAPKVLDIGFNVLIVKGCQECADYWHDWNFFLSFPLNTLAFLTGVSAGVSALSGTVIVVILAIASFFFGANTELVLAGLNYLSEEEPENKPLPFDPLAKAREAIDTVQLLRKLADMREQLQSLPVEQDANKSTFENLSALLAVAEITNSPDYQPAVSPSDAEMTRIAKAFKKYDANDDNLLQVEEIENLAIDLGKPLSKDELVVAMDVLDTDKNGTVELDEFVDWWMASSSTKQA